MKALNRRAYRSAERIVLGRDMIPRLHSGYGVAKQRCVYVPQWGIIEPSEPLPFEASPSAG
jgi:hypothetical protein